MFLTALGAAALTPGFALADRPTQYVGVDFDFRELRYFGDTRKIYPVVLPNPTELKNMQLEVGPVDGTLTQVDHKPTWWPTPNTRADRPNLPRAVPYGHRLHPLGIYRLRIAWENPRDANFWQYVRIHGGAKQGDLYERLSLGCIRMRDPDITELVALIRQHGGQLQVTFGYGLMLAPSV